PLGRGVFWPRRFVAEIRARHAPGMARFLIFSCAGRRAAMAKGNRRLGAAGQAVVVEALAGGATVRAAAKAAGFCVQTLYNERERNALFAEAWAAAVEESGRP